MTRKGLVGSTPTSGVNFIIRRLGKFMYIYNIGYGSYEGSESEQMMFSQKLDADQLHNYISKATISVLKKLVDKKCPDIALYMGGDGLTFEELFRYVIKELETMGFQKVEFEADWFCFGWASLINENDWKRDRDENLNKLSSEIPKDIKEEIINMCKEDKEKLKNI